MTHIPSLIKSLKLKWFRRLVFSDNQCSWKCVINQMLSKVAKNCNYLMFGNNFYKKLSKSCTNTFWREVFYVVYEFLSMTPEDDFLYEPLWFNSDILLNYQPFFYKRWFENGITHVGIWLIERKWTFCRVSWAMSKTWF